MYRSLQLGLACLAVLLLSSCSVSDPYVTSWKEHDRTIVKRICTRKTITIPSFLGFVPLSSPGYFRKSYGETCMNTVETKE